MEARNTLTGESEIRDAGRPAITRVMICVPPRRAQGSVGNGGNCCGDYVEESVPVKFRAG
ncbi:hypothetical protein J6590_031877 [Homalodisca vitripennis]|nr:hypothetical protein J6590_031877 [Homalodisca vitripennis]